jgi:pimeloyl-ACP methyl ester carboxylesterase
MPRTAANAVSDLHTLLKVARVPGPYVFVSHSLGGLIDRLYTATHPRRVAGMVLVDALAEYLRDPFDPAQMAAYSALNNGPVQGLDYPDLERIRFVRSFAQMRRAKRKHPLRDIPLSVISKGLPFGLPEGLPGGLTPVVLERAWRHAQDKLAKLTPDAVHVIAKRSSHYVMHSAQADHRPGAARGAGGAPRWPLNTYRATATSYSRFSPKSGAASVACIAIGK